MAEGPNQQPALTPEQKVQAQAELKGTPIAGSKDAQALGYFSGNVKPTPELLTGAPTPAPSEMPTGDVMTVYTDPVTGARMTAAAMAEREQAEAAKTNLQKRAELAGVKRESLLKNPNIMAVAAELRSQAVSTAPAQVKASTEGGPKSSGWQMIKNFLSGKRG